jgi:hypothetical protein
MEDKNQFIDELLDSALAHRRGAAPEPGLEARILEGVRAAARKRPSRGALWNFPAKGWMTVAVAAAVISVVAFVRMAERQRTPAAGTSQAVNAHAMNNNLPSATPSATALATIVEPKPTPPSERPKPRRIEAPRWPAQFPTPAPLSPEQKLLIQYVRETPPQVLATPLLKEQSSIQPLEVKPLKIQPIEIKPLELGSTQEEIQ